MVAKTLSKLVDTPQFKTIIDRSQPIEPIIDEMIKHWSYDLYTRKPGPAYTDDGVFVGTDLDLSCFISALADRGAVINIPTYKGRRAKSTKSGEMVVSANNRHGKIIGISANKEVFSFSVKILDQNVITTDSTGGYRNFMLVDIDGSWHDGWKTIDFLPTAKENDFLNNNSLWSGSEVVFSNFVHPNRWISFYGQYYLITKILLERLKEEASHYFSIIKELKDKGVTLNDEDKSESKEYGSSGPVEKVQVDAFQAEIDFPEFEGVYQDIQGKDDKEKLKNAIEKRNNFIYTISPKLRFPVRATEFAFYKNGEEGNKLPVWISGIKWDREFKLPKKRIVWNRLELSDDIALRYRVYKKTETVAAE